MPGICLCKHCFLLISISYLTSCETFTPGKFWTRFHEEYIIHNISDHGPWGGHREILWESKKPTAFSINEIIQLAQANGWTFVDSSGYYSFQTRKWTPSGQDADIAPLKNDYFDKWSQNDWKLFRFDSQWEKESEAGSGEFIPSYGNILISPNRSKMMFIYSWGQ